MMMALSLTLLLVVPSAVLSLSQSSANLSGRCCRGAGAAVASPGIHRCILRHHQGKGQPRTDLLDYYFASSSRTSRDTLPSLPPPSSSTALHMALGGNYLEDIDHPESSGPGDTNKNGKFRDGSNRWGFFGGNGDRKSAKARGNNRDGGGTSFGRGRVGTAVRPPPNGRAATGNGSPNNNYGIGGNRRQQPQQGNSGNGGGNPLVFSIRQPQDLLDFVIQDERLSVVKVYASWCKTCAVFDVRYRKLASQLGDSPSKAGSEQKKGRVRFAEMQFDDPNNEEMCRLLNATKLPYILMYKGSKGKVADFQCGPAKFQMLLDAVNEFADPKGTIAAEAGGAAAGGEQEWRVVREQQQKRHVQQANQQYGVGGSGDVLKEKEDEIARLYSELSTLRADFDRRVLLLKKEHAAETSTLNERLRAQTEQFDIERRALSKQIEDMSREMMDREKSLRTSETASAERLRGEMKEKEEEYKKTLTGLNLRITELEQDLFKSRNELRYNSDASSNDQQRLQEHIANLETEMAKLTERNRELERELVEEKRVVVASTEEASRVLKQLEKIKSSEDEERKVLAARIVDLEGQIALRETQLLNLANGGDLANEIQLELDQLKKEHEQERQLMQARIDELEQQLLYYSNNENELASQQQQQRQQQRELEKESKALSDRILELENEIDERDRLLRTSNKAADILLDNMEAQKRDYELELDRTSNLVNELEEAIAGRESEMVALRERMEGLERRMVVANKWRRREEERQSQAKVEQQQQQQHQDHQVGGESQMGGSLDQERRARIAAEREVGKLMGHLKDREDEIARMQQQQQLGGVGSGVGTPGWFGDFGALFNGGGNPASDDSGGSWYETMMNGDNNEEMESYEMLKDVLMPNEIQQPTIPNQSGVGRSENIWEGAGLSSLMDDSGGAASSGVGRSESIWEGAQRVPTPSTPSPSATELPTPAMAFERRLAENPIVPAGAFGGSKPTASFFSPKSSGGVAAPSDTPDYYQNVISNFNNNREPRRREDAQPAMPPAASYQQRPTAPSPRTLAPKMTENIYAGAGSFGGVRNIPTPVPQEEPAVQVPTPQMEFERRIAENPIVPAGAFGGSAPTAHFFSSRPAPSGGASATGGGGGEGATRFGRTSGGGGDNYRTQQSYTPEDEDSQSKWQRLDDNEKKRVAAEAYKAFEKSLEDRRGTAQGKPKTGNTGRGGAGPAAVKGGAGGSGATKRSATASAAETKKQSSLVELERKKHQEMVKAAADAAKGQSAAAKKETDASPPPSTKSVPKKKGPEQSAEQIRASAAEASAKRMSLAERAAKADQDRKKKEIRLKSEARKAQETKQMESIQRAKEAERKEEAKKIEEEAKRKEEIRRAEELKRRAEADLAMAAEAKVKADAIQVAKERKIKEDEALEQVRQGRVAEPNGSLDPAEMIEAALLGAEESNDSTRKRQPKQHEKPKQKKKTKTLKASHSRVVAGSGFAVSKKYDVMIMKDPNGDIDMPQLLEGSLKDLLKKGPSTPKRNAGDLNY